MPDAGRALPKQSPARARVLDAADRLFYTQGVRAVPVEQVISEAGVTRVTFYRHFPAKDDLIVTYLRGRLRHDQQLVERLRERCPGDPRAVLAGIVGAVVEDLAGPGFCGCAYANLAAEYRDEAHPARAVAGEHRAWLLAEVQDLLDALGAASPAVTAEQLVMLRAGAMAVASVELTENVTEGLVSAWVALIDHAVGAPVTPPRDSP